MTLPLPSKEWATLSPTSPESAIVIRPTLDGFSLTLETPATIYAGQLISLHSTLSGAARAYTVAKEALARCSS